MREIEKSTYRKEMLDEYAIDIYGMLNDFRMSLNAYINEASDVLFRFDLFTIPHSSSNFNICADERTRQKMFEYLGEFEETDERGNVTLLSVLEHKLSEERHVCSQQLRLQSSQMLKFLT
ncbi:Hypothetical predicted protein, partial [Mytilus galloprovincialis]